MGVFDSKEPLPPAQTESEQPTEEAIPEGMREIASTDGQYTILARIAVTEEDEHIILNRYLNKLMYQRKMSTNQQIKLLDKLWLEHLIVRWNLPIPLNNKEKAIERLSQQDRDFLYGQIKAAQPEKPLRQEQLGRRSLSPEIKRLIEKRQSRGEDGILSDK